MFGVNTYYPFGCLASTALPTWGESPNACFLMKDRAPRLLEKLREPGLISSPSWQPPIRRVTYLHQSEAPTWASGTQRVTRTEGQFRIQSRRRHPAGTASLRGVTEPVSFCGTTRAALPVAWQRAVSSRTQAGDSAVTNGLPVNSFRRNHRDENINSNPCSVPSSKPLSPNAQTTQPLALLSHSSMFKQRGSLGT